MFFENWLESAQTFFQTTALDLIAKLFWGLVVFVVGWFIAIGVGRAVSEILKQLRFNQIFEGAGWKEAFGKAEIKLEPAGFIGAIAKWITVIVVLLLVVDILELEEFAVFVQAVLAYIPNVIVAVLMFVAGIIIADIAEKFIRVAVERTKVGHGRLIGSSVRWFIWIFAIFSALLQLNIAVVPLQIFIETFVQALGYGLALAFALAFGLGGKEIASEVLRDIKSKFKA